jgi:hypothetical protein
MINLPFEALTRKIKSLFPNWSNEEVHSASMIERNRYLQEELGRVKMWELQNLLTNLNLKSSFIYSDWPGHERWQASQYQRRIELASKGL